MGEGPGRWISLAMGTGFPAFRPAGPRWVSCPVRHAASSIAEARPARNSLHGLRARAMDPGCGEGAAGQYAFAASRRPRVVRNRGLGRPQEDPADVGAPRFVAVGMR